MRAARKKPRCGGRWTEARHRSFIISLLRAGTMKWRPKWDAIAAAEVGPGVNPETGRKCKLHRCAKCQGLFPKNAMVADHILPVVDPIEGFQSWDVYIERMFGEVDSFQALCEGCHAAKSKGESALRKSAKRKAPVRVRR